MFSGLTTNAIHSIIDNLAVTAGLHPFSLGILPAPSGKVYICEDLKLSLNKVVNIFNAARLYRRVREDGSQNTLMPSDLERQTVKTGDAIPSMIWQMNLKRRPRTVLVLEHQSLNVASEWSKSNSRDVIMVMVKPGYT